MKIFTCVLIACCILLLSSCSFRHGYAFLDEYMAWKLRGYVSLNREQKNETKTIIRSFHAWHRTTQLNRYADYMEKLRDGMLTKNVTAVYLHKESDKLQDLIDDSMNYLMPGIANIAKTLSSEQIKQFQKKLRKEREKYKKDYIDDSDTKIQKRRIRNITRYIAPFFGRFTEEQKLILKKWEESLFPYERLMLDQQVNWERDFLKAMRFQNDALKLQQELSMLMLHRTDNWNEQLEAQLDKNQSLTFQMLATLFNSQTPKQKVKLESKFNQYIDDLRSLAKN